MSSALGTYALAATVAAQGIPFLGEMVVLFAMSALLTYLCYRLHLVPIVGFLAAGVLRGPMTPELVRAPAGKCAPGIVMTDGSGVPLPGFTSLRKARNSLRTSSADR